MNSHTCRDVLTLERAYPFCEVSNTMPVSENHDRVESPSQTVERVRPHLKAFGVTRLSDLTGLDTLGVPVWVAVRPNGYSLSVTAGKGLDRDAAIASALMEAAEYSTAESPDISVTRKSRDRLIRETAPHSTVVAFQGLNRCSAGLLDDTVELDWSAGVELITGKRTFVPHRLITLDKRIAHRSEPAADAFHRASVGLAAGNTILEAVFHGLCECIEEDSIGIWRFGSIGSTRAVQPEALGNSNIDRLAASIRETGARLRLFDVTAPDIDVPCYFAAVGPPMVQSNARYLFSDLTFGGAGCHPIPCRAAVRAITEAAQTRLVVISGARDDLTSLNYAGRTREDAECLNALLQTPETGISRATDAMFNGFRSLESQIDWILRKLANNGIGPVVAIPLKNASSRSAGVSVVRIIVSGLEADPKGSARQIGTRGLRAFLQNAHMLGENWGPK